MIDDLIRLPQLIGSYNSSNAYTLTIKLYMCAFQLLSKRTLYDIITKLYKDKFLVILIENKKD